MIKQLNMYFILYLMIILPSCIVHKLQNRKNEQPDKNLNNPLITELNDNIDFNNIFPDDITDATQYVINDANLILEEILTIPDSLRTFENTMLRLDDLYNNVAKVWNPVELLSSVSDNESIRIACDESSMVFTEYFVELSSNETLYKAVLIFSKSSEARLLLTNRKRFLNSELRDFRNSGFGLSNNKRDTLKRIQNRISKLSIDFRNNINTNTDTIFITEEFMKGLSEDYKNEREIENGLYAVDLSYPSFFTYMENAQSDSIRKLLRYKFLNKGMPENIIILDKIIMLRNQYAHILGYPSFAAYIIEESMAQTPEKVWQFENDLSTKIQKKADWDTLQLLKIKNHLTGVDDTIIYDWEKYFYENQILKNDYKVDMNRVKQYFAVENVIDGIFSISQRLFGIKYREIKEPSVWHSDVKMYEMLDSDTEDIIGKFYLDLYPRENKYQHAAEFTLISGKKKGDKFQLPVVCLVCNFPKPSKDMPSLLPHDDVETFFHEFGHLIHDLLSKTELSSQAGTSVAMDFVEAPSQMLENWTWNREALKIFARHYKTGDIIPDTLLNRMIGARNLQSGNDLLQQIFYGKLDMTLHENFYPTSNKSTSDVIIELQNRITHYPHIAGTNQLASFSHLLGYSASYYGYLWSEVYAADMYSIFENKGIFDIESGKKLRESILEHGDSENPQKLVENFLGRKLDANAFLRKQGIVE